MKKSWWEKQYKDEKCLWRNKPDPSLYQLLRWKTSGKVLDIGVGEGRNALFLARKGFEVTGIDFSKAAIGRFTERAKRLRIKVKGIATSINQFNFDKKYDIIISTATFHFLPKKQVHAVLQKMKKYTMKDGLHLITVFTEKNPAKRFSYLFKKNELKSFYGDWNVLGYKEFLTPWEKHGKNGRRHRHAVASLLARKV